MFRVALVPLTPVKRSTVGERGGEMSTVGLVFVLISTVASLGTVSVRGGLGVEHLAPAEQRGVNLDLEGKCNWFP